MMMMIGIFSIIISVCCATNTLLFSQLHSFHVFKCNKKESEWVRGIFWLRYLSLWILWSCVIEYHFIYLLMCSEQGFCFLDHGFLKLHTKTHGWNGFESWSEKWYKKVIVQIMRWDDIGMQTIISPMLCLIMTKI